MADDYLNILDNITESTVEKNLEKWEEFYRQLKRYIVKARNSNTRISVPYDVPSTADIQKDLHGWKEYYETLKYRMCRVDDVIQYKNLREEVDATIKDLFDKYVKPLRPDHKFDKSLIQCVYNSADGFYYRHEDIYIYDNGPSCQKVKIGENVLLNKQ